MSILVLITLKIIVLKNLKSKYLKFMFYICGWLIDTFLYNLFNCQKNKNSQYGKINMKVCVYLLNSISNLLL